MYCAQAIRRFDTALASAAVVSDAARRRSLV